MLFLRYQKKLVLIFLGVCLVVGFYLLGLNSDGQTRLQNSKQYFEFLNDILFYMEENLEKKDTGSNAIEKEDEKSRIKPAVFIEEPEKSGQSSFQMFLGDKYAVDDNAQQTRCPSSIRKRVLDTKFAKGFLSNVPVLQWAKHFSKTEYNRLSQYSGAHGWGSVSIDVLNESLAILNTSANRVMFDDWEMKKSRSPCIRCAVVGNAGILNGSRKGKEIDENDYVFRTNGAVIKGFEQDVGSRTSFYTFSTNTLSNSLRRYRRDGYKSAPKSPETRYIFLPDHDRDYILMRAASMRLPILQGKDRSSKPPTYFGTDVTVKNFKMYHPDFIRYIRNRFLDSGRLKSKQRNIYRPSTGAVMLLSALHTCDEVHAYGFMTPDYMKYSDHYYDKTIHQVRFYANHDLQMELKLWQSLHNAGLMKLYMRS